MNAKDRLFEEAMNPPDQFVFDERVVHVFPDMIERSVPGYGWIVPTIGLLARRYARPQTRLYDLGCSLGAVAFAMQRAVRAKETRIVAVDDSPAMIRRLEELVDARSDDAGPQIEVLQADIRALAIENASVAVLNFTLQFVDPDERDGLARRIAEGLIPGGALVLSEKVCFEDSSEQALQEEWHRDFKRAQGYSDLEIARKRDALEKVLIPDTLGRHRERLLSAGFSGVYRWYQGFNFVSIIAIR